MFTGNVTGSAKCDAYLWAIQQYILNPNTALRCDASKMGYFVDAFWSRSPNAPNSYLSSTISNHDYFISKKAFFWDLDVWGDVAPNDDPNQPIGTDKKTLLAIFDAANQQTAQSTMIHIGGFIPWLYKYCDPYSKHGGVDSEWEGVMILSSYNAYLDADACCLDGMANAAFYTHFPLAQRYVQNPAPSRETLQANGWLNSDGSVAKKSFNVFYVGDYDSASWVYAALLSKWQSADRGKVPLAWAIDPNLSRRFPVIWPLLFATKTPNDRFITGDSGAGYVNPTQLFPPRVPSGYPSGTELWVKHSTPLYRQFDMRITGFVLNGDSGPVGAACEEMYLPYSYQGIIDELSLSGSGVHLRNNTAVLQQQDFPGPQPSDAVKAVLQSRHAGTAEFNVWRSVLQEPSYYVSIVDQLQPHADDIIFVDPLAALYLARVALGGNNNDIVSYIDDTFPALPVKPNAQLAVHVLLRNEGWNVMFAHELQLVVQIGSREMQVPLTADIGSSLVGSVGFTVNAPADAGVYQVEYFVQRRDGSPFSLTGNLPWATTLTVTHLL
eukprot:TRINITY_DN1236_c0_g1_i2.p1 TRINITY_DN1236_c0_g1~~TRINITY_DN1236_c0_g1_i2.p1  ORF type:complete len:552 (-),score=130.44 TRINITY_DN1236_c0_g1_i2:87-1742(-)